MNSGAVLTVAAFAVVMVMVATVDLSQRRTWLVSGGLGVVLMLSAPVLAALSPAPVI